MYFSNRSNLYIYHHAPIHEHEKLMYNIFFPQFEPHLDKLNAQAAHMQKCLQDACDEMGAKLEIELKTNYVSFNVANDDPMVQRVFESCKRIGCEPMTAKGGGGSDANVMALHGIKPIVLSTGMTKVHTTGETLKIENLNKCAELVLDLMTH